MKKLVVPGFAGNLRPYLTLLVMLLLAFANRISAQQGCVMSCPPMEPPVELGLSSDCEDKVTYGLIGVVIDDCPGEIVIDIQDNGESLGDTIRAEMIGNTYMVIISHPASGQSCMTMIKVVDKQAPLVNCPDDITLECTADLDAYNPIASTDISDCSSTIIYKSDELQFSGMCQNSIISEYLRTYIIVDAYNNADTCEQIISLQKEDLGNVEFPQDLIGIDALNCFPLPDTSPVNTGYPSVDGDEIVNGQICNLSAVYDDAVGSLCSGGYKILRTWTVYDWCNSPASSTAVQTIEVLDLTPPEVEAPDDITVSTGSQGCLADVNITSADIYEDCSDYTVRMEIEGAFNPLYTNGGLVEDLSKGTHRIIFIATNDCGLEGADTMYVTVKDFVPPGPVCNLHLAIPVNHLGTTLVPATIFDGGSTDNCGEVYVKVKRMTTPQGYTCANPGNPDNLFDDYVQFCCEDIPNNNIRVILRVYDVPPVPGPVSDDYLEGHFNECMVQVEVQDKLPPVIECPTDLTISCQFPYTEDNLDVFGSIALSEETREDICIDDPGFPGNPGLQCIGRDGLAIDNCDVTIEELDPIMTMNDCNLGTIIRTFVATDNGSLQASCQQVITIVNYDPFSAGDINWPEDYTTNDICDVSLLDPEDLEAPYNRPALADKLCSMAASTHEDEVYDFSNNDQACFKILRKWTVMDWCQLDSLGGGIWTRTQVIKVMNTIGPEIEPIADIDECSLELDCGGKVIEFTAEAGDACSGPASLSWRYFIDIDNDNSFEFTSSIITGGSITFSYDMPLGNHRILYSVSDLCGNVTYEDQLVTVRSCVAPNAICHFLGASLMPQDLNGDGEPDWGMVTIDASMFDSGSEHPCGSTLSFAFSSDSTDKTRVFSCDTLGVLDIEMWVFDQNGLSDVCLATINVQDNQNVCPQGLGNSGTISGIITVPQQGTLSGAMVYLEGSNHPGMPSASNGHFVFPAMPLGGEYIVRPEREGDAKNGVSTLDLIKIQKHLLGLETFSSPYQYIAADINNSESISAIDIIQLRKLILGFYDAFPNNKSWRFIDKAHIFPDPADPWKSEWAETYSIIPFANSMNDVDFNAVKIGDLNLSASLSAHGGMIMGRGDQSSEVEYIVNETPEKNIYRVDLYLNEAERYNGLQFSFDWDKISYQLLDWTPGEYLNVDDFRMPENENQNASVSAYTLEGWSDQKIQIATLWVEKVSSTLYPFQLFLNPQPTQPLTFTKSNEEEVNLRIVSSPKLENKIENRPNPFTNMTTIYMESNRDEPATLRVFDLNGRLVHTEEVRLLKGKNEFVVRQSDVRTTGILMYEIESNFQYSTNRMIIVE